MTEPTAHADAPEAPVTIQCQDHVCTAVIEELAASTPESAWDGIDE